MCIVVKYNKYLLIKRIVTGLYPYTRIYVCDVYMCVGELTQIKHLIFIGVYFWGLDLKEYLVNFNKTFGFFETVRSTRILYGRKFKLTR